MKYNVNSCFSQHYWLREGGDIGKIEIMGQGNKKFTSEGFTLVELLVVIAIISLLSSVVIASLRSAREKARDARRLSDIHQLTLAFNLYVDSNGDFPAEGGVTHCIGVPAGQTCWGDRVMPGSDSLITALTPYISVLPTDPLPDRGWGDRYLYNDGFVNDNCTASTIYGRFILWRTEKTSGTDRDCLGKGIFACCGSGGPCGNEGGYYCAYQLD